MLTRNDQEQEWRRINTVILQNAAVGLSDFGVEIMEGRLCLCAEVSTTPQLGTNRRRLVEVEKALKIGDGSEHLRPRFTRDRTSGVIIGIVCWDFIPLKKN